MERRELIKSLGALAGVSLAVGGADKVVTAFKVEPKARYLFVVQASEDFGIVARQLSQLGVEGAILPCYGDPEEAIRIYKIEET